uniref:Uncharacterized protein n=1 Tax=Cuerna arida TaxID=1464854 RepID=A0A1B6FRU5_9HEMI
MSASNTHRKNILLKVVILGDGGVGKSCLMNRFVSNNFDSHSFHTVGVEFFNKDIEVNGEWYTLQVDLASEKREVEEAEIRSWCEENGEVPMIETSAKDAINVDTAFAMAVERWNKLEEFLEKSNNYCGDTVDLRNHHGAKVNKKAGCCT